VTQVLQAACNFRYQINSVKSPKKLTAVTSTRKNHLQPTILHPPTDSCKNQSEPTMQAKLKVSIKEKCKARILSANTLGMQVNTKQKLLV